MAPPDSDTLLTRDQVAAALTAAGFPVSPKTLATKAVRGGGPPYQIFGTKRSLYRWGSALAWAQSRLSVTLSQNENPAALPAKESCAPGFNKRLDLEAI
jgi:hypothetical protein